MAEFLNLYKIQNLETGTITDFLSGEDLEDFIENKNGDLTGYKVYSLNMENITPYLYLKG